MKAITSMFLLLTIAFMQTGCEEAMPDIAKQFANDDLEVGAEVADTVAPAPEQIPVTEQPPAPEQPALTDDQTQQLQTFIDDLTAEPEPPPPAPAPEPPPPPPPPPNRDGDYPFDLHKVKWVCGNTSVADWPVTVVIGSASVGRAVTWSYDIAPGNWPRTSRIKNDPNACLGWVTKVNGQWYGAIAEWLLPGQTQQSRIIFQSDRGNKKLFHEPLRDFEAQSGQTFYLFMCGLNMSGLYNVHERSNLVAVKYP